MTYNLRNLALPGALAATLALTSCGSASSPTANSTPKPAATATASGTQSPVGPPNTLPSNTSDVAWASSTVANHLQANAMADLARQRTSDVNIKALAARVKKAHGPEVTTIAGWLVGGKIPVPDATGGHDMGAGGAGGHDMSGMAGMAEKTPVMISAKEMTALAKADGAAFDRLWLQMMIKHHQGASASAKTELTKGLNKDAKKIAQVMIDRQSGEITTMKSTLAGMS